MDEPPTLESYLDWHADTLKEDLRAADLGTKYDANAILLQSVTTSHPFLAELAARLSELAAKGVFQDRTRPPDLTLLRKPFPSVVEKIYRINQAWNRRWPDVPRGGWVTYQNSYERIDDIIRTTLVTRYLDGPELVSNEVLRAAQTTGLEAIASPRATDNGYYAWHAYVDLPTKIILSDAPVDVKVKVEFQTTTLLQSALRDLTHRLYEERRTKSPVGRTESRWDYASQHFRGEFLGHTLHLVDAMILELRDGANAPQEDETSSTTETGSSEEISHSNATNPEVQEKGVAPE